MTGCPIHPPLGSRRAARYPAPLSATARARASSPRDTGAAPITLPAAPGPVLGPTVLPGAVRNCTTSSLPLQRACPRSLDSRQRGIVAPPRAPYAARVIRQWNGADDPDGRCSQKSSRPCVPQGWDFRVPTTPGQRAPRETSRSDGPHRAPNVQASLRAALTSPAGRAALP